MELAFEYRIYPNREQQTLIAKTFGCCRFVFNRTLNLKSEEYDKTGKSSHINEYIKMLPKWKKELEWLREVDSMALQQSERDLDKAFQNFFRGRGFPKFKTRRNKRQSYRTNKVEIIDDKHIKLPKLGVVKARISRELQERVLSATIKRVPSGKYFVKICCTEVPLKDLAPKDAVGVDVGIKSMLITSDGEIFDNPKNTKKYAKKLAREQRRLARTKKKSNNHQKQRRKVARVHEKIANSRKDAIHKATSAITKEYQIVCTEDLNTCGMLKNHKLAKAVADASFAEIIRQLEYKSRWRSGKIVKVDRFFPSSKLCSNCGHKMVDMPLDVREWTCPSCGKHHDRDINAAINILNEGLEILTVAQDMREPQMVKSSVNACGVDVRPC